MSGSNEYDRSCPHKEQRMAPICDFIEEQCDVGLELRVQSRTLYRAYIEWATRESAGWTGHGDMHQFTSQMRRHGWTVKQGVRFRQGLRRAGYLGLGLKS